MTIHTHQIKNYSSYPSIDAYFLNLIDQENSGKLRKSQENSQKSSIQQEIYVADSIKHPDKNINQANKKLIQAHPQPIAKTKREGDLICIKDIIKKYLQYKKNRNFSYFSNSPLQSTFDSTRSYTFKNNKSKKIYSSWHLTEPSHSIYSHTKKNQNSTNLKRKRENSISFINHTYPQKILPRPIPFQNIFNSNNLSIPYKKRDIKM